MANSIAFSVGSGGGGSIIKSIQRGESPIYTLHGEPRSSDQRFDSTKRIYTTLNQISISPVNPAKSIIQLSRKIVESPGTTTTPYDWDVTLLEFQNNYFTCKMGYKNWTNVDDGSSLYGYDDDISTISEDLKISLNAYYVANDKYWIDNIYSGSGPLAIPTDFVSVSYQIIEFY